MFGHLKGQFSDKIEQRIEIGSYLSHMCGDVLIYNEKKKASTKMFNKWWKESVLFHRDHNWKGMEHVKDSYRARV